MRAFPVITSLPPIHNHDFDRDGVVMSTKWLVSFVLLITILYGSRLAGQKAVPSWQLVADLTLDATADDLSPINWIAVARNGDIAVGQPQDFRIRFFDLHGTAVASVGQKGSGPGEFKSLDRAGWLGDTLWVSDGAQVRLSMISGKHEFVHNVPRSIVVRAAVRDSGPSARVLTTLALYSGGSQLVFALLSLDPSAPRPKWTEHTHETGSPSLMIRMTSDGLLQRIVAWTPYDECGLSMSARYVFCARPLADIAPDGSRIAFVTMATNGPESGKYRVSVLAANGDTVFSRNYPFTRITIPREVNDSLASLAAKQPKPPARPGMEKQAPFPTAYPPIKRVVVGLDGTVWLELRPVNGRKPYVVLDRKGNPIGTFSMPSSASIRVASLKTVWTIEKDADDLDSVVRYQVTDGR